jgi:predicted kinase
MLMKPKRVYLLCGAPGSGKSSWAKAQIEQSGGIWLSRDNVRFSLLTEEDEYFAKETEVFNTWIHQINEAIHNEEGVTDIYVDATHLNEKSRNKTLSRLDRKNVRIIPVYFDTPFLMCLKQNNYRSGRERVPEEVIGNMYKSIKRPTHKEKYKYEDILVIKRGAG